MESEILIKTQKTTDQIGYRTQNFLKITKKYPGIKKFSWKFKNKKKCFFVKFFKVFLSLFLLYFIYLH